MHRLILTLVFCAFAGTAGAIWLMPSDADHAAATDARMLADYADPPGQGVLDGLRFDTTLGLQGTDEALVDYMQFDTGLFMSRECTDRCNYPPSAYLTRATTTGTDFLIEAFCPTKSTTMVWRGTVAGDQISGTVTWQSRRLTWSTTTVLEFNGTLSDQPAALEPL